MKTLKFISQTAMVAAATVMLSLVYTGCKKQDDATPTSNNQSTTLTSDDAIGRGIDNNLLSASFDDVLKISDQVDAIVTGAPLGTSFTLADCGTVSVDNNIKTIDYGSTACLGKDGNYRSGSIIISDGTIAFKNYALNFNTLNGTITRKYLGENEKGNLMTSIIIDGSILQNSMYDINNKATTLSFHADWIKELIYRGEVGNVSDNIYAIHGNVSGTSASGSSYTATVDASNPLISYYGFPQYTCGVMNFEVGVASALPADGSASTARVAGNAFHVDYNYMNCQKDNLAQVIMDDGRSYTFVLNKTAK